MATFRLSGNNIVCCNDLFLDTNYELACTKMPPQTVKHLRRSTCDEVQPLCDLLNNTHENLEGAQKGNPMPIFGMLMQPAAWGERARVLCVI